MISINIVHGSQCRRQPGTVAMLAGLATLLAVHNIAVAAADILIKMDDEQPIASASAAAPASHPSCGEGSASYPGCLRKPPMGWMSWEIFRCDVDCETNPTACINHVLYEQMTDHIAADGFLSAGYNQGMYRNDDFRLKNDGFCTKDDGYM